MAGKQNMSAKEIMACENYLKGMSLRKALLAAGYSPNYCDGNPHLFNWIKRRHICEYLRERQKQIVKVFNKDKGYIISKIEHILEDDNPKDRVQALLLLERMVVPKEMEEYKKEDVKGITINFNEIKKPE